MKVSETSLNKTILTLTLFSVSCGDVDNEDNQRKISSPVIHTSINVVESIDADFNVYEAKKIFNRTGQGVYLSTERNNIRSAALNSRSSANIKTYRRTLNNVNLCIDATTPNQKGTGQLVSYSTLLTAHHVASFDDSRDIYLFGSNLDESSWGAAPSPKSKPDDLWLRERLYRLGFNAKFGLTDDLSNPKSVDFNDVLLDRQIKNWDFNIDKDYYGSNFHDGKRRDLVLEQAEPKCIDEFNVYIHGPGLFFDWSEPSRPDGKPGYAHPKTSNSIYGLMFNNLDKNKPNDLYGLVALPGTVDFSISKCAPVSGATDCNPITNYEGCSATTIDVTGGSSGGAGLFFAPTTPGRGMIWSNAQGARWTSSAYNQDSWGFNESADHPNTTPDPNRAYTTHTTITNNVVDDIENHRRGNTTPNGSAQPPRNIDLEKPRRNLTIKDVETAGPCIGRRCTDKPNAEEIVKISCAQLYEEYFSEWADNDPNYVYSGMGIGITGVPYYSNVGVTTIGTLGMVCAPWSPLPYTETWEYVSHNTVKGNYAQAWTHKVPIKMNPFPFSYELTRNSITKKDGKNDVPKTFPFQMCAPGYVLKGLRVRMLPQNIDPLEQSTLVGVSHIRCEKNYTFMPGKNIVDVPLIPTFNNTIDPDMKIETLIGDIDSSDDNLGEGTWLECQSGLHISGFEIDIKSTSGPPSYLSLLCTRTPPQLEANLCDRNQFLDIPGSPLRSFGFPRPSCSTPGLFQSPSNNAKLCSP